MTPLATGLLLAAAFAALLAGRLQIPADRGRAPFLTLAVLLVLAVALAAQSVWPQLLLRFRRDADAIARGEVYRLFTALWFQDGGLAGGAFNLTILLLLGSTAERLWDRRAWLMLYLGVGLAIGVLALAWKPIGAGNSIACFGLAGGILVPIPKADRRRILPIVQGLGLCAGAALALDRDIHGAALLSGAILGFILSRLPGSPGRPDHALNGSGGSAE